MANELKVNVEANLRNGNHSVTFAPGVVAVTQAAIGGIDNVVSVGTSEEVISIGDVATLGWCFLRNLDATNYVEWGPTSAGAMVGVGRLEPGEVAACRLKPGITLRMQANTAACKVRVTILED